MKQEHDASILFLSVLKSWQFVLISAGKERFFATEKSARFLTDFFKTWSLNSSSGCERINILQLLFSLLLRLVEKESKVSGCFHMAYQRLRQFLFSNLWAKSTDLTKISDFEQEVFKPYLAKANEGNQLAWLVMSFFMINSIQILYPSNTREERRKQSLCYFGLILSRRRSWHVVHIYIQSFQTGISTVKLRANRKGHKSAVSLDTWLETVS